MKRLTRKILITATAIALTVGTLASVAWVVATTQGTRWLLTSLLPLSGVSFSAQKIEGRIIDHLLLTKVRVDLGEQKLEIGTLELRWKPLPLLMGTIALQELVINEIRIQDDTPLDNKPPNLDWPRLSGNAELFNGRITRLLVTNLRYRRLQEQPILVTSIACSVTWQDNLLSLEKLIAVSPAGRLQGTLSAGFRQPSLTADLAIALSQPLAEMDRFSLQARPGSNPGPEQFTGTITIGGSAGSRKLLELSGDMGMAKSAITMRRLHLTKPNQKGVVSADGTLEFTALESFLSLQVKATGLDLAPELNVPTNLSGSLRFAGTLNSYQGDITLTNQAKGWQAAELFATYKGTADGMKLAPFNAKLLDGSLTGNLDMEWRDGFAMRGAISGKGLNPARIDPAWRGVVNFTSTGFMTKRGKEPLTGSVSAALLESRLHGQALTGQLEAAFIDNNLTLNRLTLKGKGFDLRAAGELNKRLTLAAEISDFSLLVPGSTGTLQADGWLRWRDGELSGAVTGTGSRLAYAGTRIAAADLTARLEQGSGYPMHVGASLRNLSYDNYALEKVTLDADGTLPRHTIHAMLDSAGSQARLTLSAGYTSGIWKGEINRLAGRDNSGPWNLTAPAEFSVSAGRISLSPLILSAAASERLEVAVDLALNPVSGLVRAQWTGIDLQRLKPLFPHDTALTGEISGQAKGIMLPGQRFELDGTAMLSGGTLRQVRPDGDLNLSFSSAKASWGWRGEALTGTLSFTMTEYGQAKGSFQLPIPARFPVAANPKGPLRASLAAQVQEKGIITALFPGLVRESSGELAADLAVTGSWEAPQVAGKLRLEKAGAYLPTAGIHLKDLRIAARLEKNLIRIDSFRALSGPGHIEGTALLTLSGRQVVGYQGTIRGENFQTVYFPELQMLTTPKLTFEGTAQKITIRGDLTLPELLIVGAPVRTVITPSSDVIREGRAVPSAKRPSLAMDVQVRLLLGDKVFAKVSGIDAQFGGTMELSFSTLDRIMSRGEIKVVKGRYRTYGVNLEIVRGRLFFAGGSIDRPTLDFLALRTIGNVRAGVTVTGTLLKPVTKLYSEPAMPDVDVLAYIVLGHPLGSSGEQVSLMNQAAGALLSTSQASVLQEQLKNRLGLSTLEIQGGVGGSAGYMGYKPLQVTAPGAIPAAEQTGITETVLTMGKYLTPQLYISYGKSLFTGSNLFRLRYDIFKQWQIETQTGSGESGADLFYKLEFM